MRPQLLKMTGSVKWAFSKAMHDEDGKLKEFVVEMKLDGGWAGRFLGKAVGLGGAGVRAVKQTGDAGRVAGWGLLHVSGW